MCKHHREGVLSPSIYVYQTETCAPCGSSARLSRPCSVEGLEVSPGRSAVPMERWYSRLHCQIHRPRRERGECRRRSHEHVFVPPSGLLSSHSRSIRYWTWRRGFERSTRVRLSPSASSCTQPRHLSIEGLMRLPAAVRPHSPANRCSRRTMRCCCVSIVLVSSLFDDIIVSPHRSIYKVQDDLGFLVDRRRRF